MTVAVLKQEHVPLPVEDLIFEACGKMFAAGYRIIGIGPSHLIDLNGFCGTSKLHQATLFTAALMGKAVCYIKYDKGNRTRIDTDKILLREYGITPVQNFAICDGFMERNHSIFAGIHTERNFYLIGQRLRMKLRSKGYSK